jgi:23S rRNA pseudouridine1911/1915/1917 synthase
MNAAWSVQYCDKHLLIVEKPAGLPTQAPAGGGRNLFDAVRAEYPTLTLHHRIDQPVSGLVLFTLEPRLNAAVTEALRRHEIERSYIGCVLGVPSQSGVWDSPIDSKAARTRFERIRTDGRRTVLALTLQTGRTHQIRRHAVGAGHPLLGDRRYGGAAGTLFTRVALHASRIRWTHPVTGRPVDVQSPIPPDLEALLRSIAA